MRLESIVQALGPLATSGPLNAEIRGVVYDSRQVRPDYLFIAMPGDHVDGAGFLDDAIRRGAAAVVTEHPPGSRRDIAWVQVRDARRAAAEAACVFFDHPSARMRVVGITGTNGKTTTAFMARDVLAASGWNPGIIGTVEYRIGARVIPASRTTPQAIDLQSMLDQMVQAGCKSAVMEVSSHSLDQKRVWGIDFDVAVFTNLTRDHLDYHRTREQYFEAKKLLFAWLGLRRKDAHAVINLDDPYGAQLAAMAGLKAEQITFGCSANALVRATDIALDGRGSRFSLESPWGGATVRLKLSGRYNVSNALAAAAACGALGVDIGLVADVLSRVTCVPGRLEEVPTDRGFQVFVDYAHTDDALSNVLRCLRELTRGRLIVVFGCGGNRDTSKRPAMGEVAAALADFTVLTSDNPRREKPADIIEQIRAGFGAKTSFRIVEERAEAIRAGLAMAREGDTVLVAGKGHETFQEFANTVIPFDDRSVVRKILAETA